MQGKDTMPNPKCVITIEAKRHDIKAELKKEQFNFLASLKNNIYAISLTKISVIQNATSVLGKA